MAKFRWKGRSRDGHEVTGELVAGSKEDIIRQLRERGVMVSSITEFGDGEPSDPDVAYGRVHGGPRVPQQPQRFKGFLIALAFIAAAAAIGYFAPAVTYRCSRDAGRVDCTVTESIYFVYPLRTQSLNASSSMPSELTTFIAGSEPTIKITQVQQAPMLISAILGIIGAMLLLGLVVSLFAGPQKWLGAQAEAAQRILDERKRNLP